MDSTSVFRKYLCDTTNNVPMVDAIMNLHQESGTDSDGQDLFAESLFAMIPSLDLCQTICNIRDLVFDLGSTLEVDPRYEDAAVEYEARPKNTSICTVMPLKPERNMLADGIVKF